MKCLSSSRGSAPVLAVFLIFIVISTALVVSHIHSTTEREVSSIQLLMSSDIAAATMDGINAELEDTLFTATTAAMYDVGMGGGNRENIENYLIEYLNGRIEKGWSYPGLEVDVPFADENSVFLYWKPDGRLEVRVCLDSRVEHIRGPAAYGTFIQVSPHPRFLRIRHVAEQWRTKLLNGLRPENLSLFENDLDENYGCEGIDIDLDLVDNSVFLNAADVYGSRIVVVED